MIIHDRRGGRRIELLLPFEFMGRKIDAVTIAGFKWDHTLRWKEGRFGRPLDLLIEMSGLEENILRELMYPDVDRVMKEFLDVLPLDIRQDIDEGRIPERMNGQGQQEGPIDYTQPPQPSLPLEQPPMPSAQDDGLGFELDR